MCCNGLILYVCSCYAYVLCELFECRRSFDWVFPVGEASRLGMLAVLLCGFEIATRQRVAVDFSSLDSVLLAGLVACQRRLPLRAVCPAIIVFVSDDNDRRIKLFFLLY